MQRTTTGYKSSLSRTNSLTENDDTNINAQRAMQKMYEICENLRTKILGETLANLSQDTLFKNSELDDHFSHLKTDQTELLKFVHDSLIDLQNTYEEFSAYPEVTKYFQKLTCALLKAVLQARHLDPPIILSIAEIIPRCDEIFDVVKDILNNNIRSGLDDERVLAVILEKAPLAVKANQSAEPTKLPTGTYQTDRSEVRKCPTSDEICASMTQVGKKLESIISQYDLPNIIYDSLLKDLQPNTQFNLKPQKYRKRLDFKINLNALKKIVDDNPSDKATEYFETILLVLLEKALHEDNLDPSIILDITRKLPLAELSKHPDEVAKLLNSAIVKINRPGLDQSVVMAILEKTPSSYLLSEAFINAISYAVDSRIILGILAKPNHTFTDAQLENALHEEFVQSYQHRVKRVNLKVIFKALMAKCSLEVLMQIYKKLPKPEVINQKYTEALKDFEDEMIMRIAIIHGYKTENRDISPAITHILGSAFIKIAKRA